MAGDVETEIEHELQHVEDAFGVMQKISTLVANGQSDLNQNSAHCDIPEVALGKCRLECFHNTSDYDSGKALVLKESGDRSTGNSSSSHGLDLAQDDGSKKLELDKNLPPIKTRREGQLREHSPSDLSPPSPKRLRQGSKEGQDQWNGLWSAEGMP
eukprot:c13706_g1_i1 orf=170-637(+)